MPIAVAVGPRPAAMDEDNRFARSRLDVVSTDAAGFHELTLVLVDRPAHFIPLPSSPNESRQLQDPIQLQGDPDVAADLHLAREHDLLAAYLASHDPLEILKAHAEREISFLLAVIADDVRHRDAVDVDGTLLEDKLYPFLEAAILAYGPANDLGHRFQAHGSATPAGFWMPRLY